MPIVGVLRRRPALALDLHDWYAETFLAPGEVRRPAGPVRVWLAPVGAAPSAWPFAGEIELVLVTGPSGMTAFFDLARLSHDRHWRFELPPGNYRGRVQAPGFQEEAFAVPVPAARSVSVELKPGVAYPFPPGRQPNGLPGPTLLRGTILGVSGDRLANVRVTAPVRTQIPEARTDATGQWVLVLDRPDDLGQLAASPVDLRFDLPEGTVNVTGFPFELGRENSFPLTSLEGFLRTSAGVPASGAAVEVVGLAPASRSRADGAWSYVFPLDGLRAGRQTVQIRAKTPDGKTGTIQVDLRNGERNRVDPIILA